MESRAAKAASNVDKVKPEAEATKAKTEVVQTGGGDCRNNNVKSPVCPALTANAGGGAICRRTTSVINVAQNLATGMQQHHHHHGISVVDHRAGLRHDDVMISVANI